MLADDLREGKLEFDEKGRVNAALAAAAGEAARRAAGGAHAGAQALVLDSSSGQTSKALVDTAMFAPGCIRVPNTFTHCVASLRAMGLRSWVGDVGDFLQNRDPSAEPFVFVDLDYCGGVPQRLPHLEAVFARHIMADGGLLAVAFTYNGVGPGEDAVAIACDALNAAAARHGYVLTRREAGRASWAPHMLFATHDVHVIR